MNVAPPRFTPQNLVQAQPMQSFVPQVAKIKKGGMFGSGLGFGQILAHGLLGAAAANGNTAPLQAYYGNQQREAEAKLAEQNYQRQMRDNFALWQAQQDYARRNPKPTSLQQNADYLNSVEGGLGDSYLRNQANPPQMVAVNNLDGSQSLQLYRPPPMPRPGEVIDGYVYLGGDPSSESSYRPVGDAGGNASGGFQY